MTKQIASKTQTFTVHKYAANKRVIQFVVHKRPVCTRFHIFHIYGYDGHSEKRSPYRVFQHRGSLYKVDRCMLYASSAPKAVQAFIHCIGKAIKKNGSIFDAMKKDATLMGLFFDAEYHIFCRDEGMYAYARYDKFAHNILTDQQLQKRAKRPFASTFSWHAFAHSVIERIQTHHSSELQKIAKRELSPLCMHET